MDQSSARGALAQVVRGSAPSPLKVWTNSVFVEDEEDDTVVDTRAVVQQEPVAGPRILNRTNTSQQRNSGGWSNPDNAMRSSMPGDTRSSASGVSPRQPSPRTTQQHRNSQAGTHRLSQAGSILPSPSSARVSTTGSEIYPLGQLFHHTSGSASPTACDDVTPIEGLASRECSTLYLDSGAPRECLPSALTVPSWTAQVKELLSSQLRQQAVSLVAPEAGLVRCYVRRSKGVLGGIGKPGMYRMFLEEGDVELMSAVKSKPLVGAASPTYTLYYEGDAVKGKSEGGSSVGIAKLSPNAAGSQYHLRGTHPAAKEDPNVPLQLCISYEEQTTRSELRSMHCLVPVEQACLPSPSKSKEALQPKGKGKMMMLCTRQPDYDDVNGFTLPIDDRFFITSIKNFQLVKWHLHSASRGTQTLLQFGKLDKDLFALDFAAPLCAKTAFSIALAAAEAKYLNSNL